MSCWRKNNKLSVILMNARKNFLDLSLTNSLLCWNSTLQKITYQNIDTLNSSSKWITICSMIWCLTSPRLWSRPSTPNWCQVGPVLSPPMVPHLSSKTSFNQTKRYITLKCALYAKAPPFSPGNNNLMWCMSLNKIWFSKIVAVTMTMKSRDRAWISHKHHKILEKRHRIVIW